MIDKTLYIADLDGTLLNENSVVSPYTTATLRLMHDQGFHFSVATARTTETAPALLDDIPLSVPIVLMNGVLIYETETKEYKHKVVPSKTKAKQVVSVMKELSINGLMYTLDGEQLNTYYKKSRNAYLNDFIQRRIRLFDKKFTQIEDYNQAIGDSIYFSFIDSRENTSRLYEGLSGIEGLCLQRYHNTRDDNIWYLEAFDARASKGKGVEFLRREYGFSKVVGFGDNLNDISLFKACDEGYAVENAKPALKERANAVIGSNRADVDRLH